MIVRTDRYVELFRQRRRLATPRWRRPNEAGNWGIVPGRDWKRVERRQLMSM
jgi:hypothetical protein